jgi:hypothetical protein
LRAQWVKQYEKTDWDFDSIMLYDGFKIRPGYVNILNKGITQYNKELFLKDIEIIKRIY